jgi:hypothetical protein
MNVDFLKNVALAVAQEQHLETVMKMMVEGINEEPDVALVRLWILESEDNSTECHLRPRLQTKPVACIWSRVPDTPGHPFWSTISLFNERLPAGS